jgi:putative solute:sodium symporter small subunit
MITKETLDSYWRENKTFMYFILLIWALVSYGAALVASSLNSIVIFGFPFGYYMGSQGAITVFVILNLIYSLKMNQLDKKYGVEEE